MQAERRRLHVAFTINCEPASTRWAPQGPKGWERSGRAIYGFSRRLLDSGYPPTLFLTPASAEMHAPLIEELSAGGAEAGLLLQPHSLRGAAKRYLGQLDRDRQREVISTAIRSFERAVGRRPRSARSAMFSANDDTFPLLREHGVLQGSLSVPGRRVVKHAAVWTGAPSDPHYVDPNDRLKAGSLQILEVPVTADARRVVGGLSSDLMLEHGAFDTWHRPLLDGQLARMRSADGQFSMVCSYTSSACPYDVEDEEPTKTLRAILTYLDQLEDRFDVRPVTLATAHAAFGRTSITATSKDATG